MRACLLLLSCVSFSLSLAPSLLAQIDTPALCVSMDALEANCDALAALMAPYAGKVPPASAPIQSHRYLRRGKRLP